jgi:hypothetical protein
MMVGLDIDGVLADFVCPFLRVLEERAGIGCIDPQTYVDLNFSDHPELSREIVTECILKVSNDRKFGHSSIHCPSPNNGRSWMI